MPKKNNSLTGVAGEHYVCAELAKRGYIALMTPKNNPLFDVVATNQEGTHSVSIQVKTKATDNRQGWKLGVDMERKTGNPDLLVVLVDLKAEGSPDFYVYERDVLAARIADLYKGYLSKPKRDGTAKKEVSFRWFDLRDFSPADHGRKNQWGSVEQRLNGGVP